MDSSRTLEISVLDTVLIGTLKEQKTFEGFDCPFCEVLVLRSKFAIVTNQSNAPSFHYSMTNLEATL